MDQIIKDPWAGLRQLQCITFLGKGSGWRSLKVGVCQREQALQRTCGGHGEEGILPQHRQGPVSGTSLQGSLGGGPDRGGNRQGKQEAGRRPGHRKPHGISGHWGWVRSRCLWCLCGVMGEGQTDTHAFEVVCSSVLTSCTVDPRGCHLASTVSRGAYPKLQLFAK